MVVLKKIFLALSCFVLMPHANAAFIATDNASLVVSNALTLNETFEDFYGYDTGASNSSNTGLEQDETLVMFIANFMGEYALFGLFDGFTKESPSFVSTANLQIVDNSTSLGSLRFVDDAAFDTFSSNGNVSDFQYRWQSGKNDGFIYQLGDYTNFDVSLSLSNLNGIRAVNILGFNGNSDTVSLTSSGNDFRLFTPSDTGNLAEAVPEPKYAFMFAIVLIVVSSLKRRFH